MQTRTIRAGSGALTGALLVLAAGNIGAAPPTLKPESSLLGIRLLSKFDDVLHKLGQPTEIQVGEPTASADTSSSTANRSGSGPGLPGMGSPGGKDGSNSYQGNSYPGGGPMTPPPGYGNNSGGSPNGGYPGSGGYPGNSGSGLPGFSPGAPSGMPGNSGGGSGNSTEKPPSDETTWWYHYPKLGLHYSFLFNKDGKVIQIQAYGYKPSPKVVAPRSAEGITLGDSMGQIIKRYGWSNDGEHSGDYVVLRYGGREQIAFQSRHNRVLGIVLAIVDK